MTREEYDRLFYAVRTGTVDAFVVMDAVIDLFYDHLELQTKVQELQGRIYELEEMLDAQPTWDDLRE